MGHGYKDFVLWQKAMDLSVAIYQLTEKLPASEMYGLTSQMRRAAVSIPSNIAEGSKHESPKDTHHFYVIAYGSGAELETQIELTRRLYPEIGPHFSEVESLLDEVMKMMNVITHRQREAID